VFRRFHAFSRAPNSTRSPNWTRASAVSLPPPAELSGSTFTLNNYGSLGVDGAAAIINHPVAILGLGRMMKRAWVVVNVIENPLSLYARL